MEFFHNLTDDQLALLGCAAALVLSGTVMALSYFVGRARHRPVEPRTIRKRDVVSPPAPDDFAAAPERRRVA